MSWLKEIRKNFQKERKKLTTTYILRMYILLLSVVSYAFSSQPFSSAPLITDILMRDNAFHCRHCIVPFTKQSLLCLCNSIFCYVQVQRSGTDVMIFKIFSPKNWQKSQKIVIITLTPGKLDNICIYMRLKNSDHFHFCIAVPRAVFWRRLGTTFPTRCELGPKGELCPLGRMFTPS
jgi:hypothetical protein